MSFAETVARRALVVGVAVAVQWLTTIAVAARADGVSIDVAALASVALVGPVAIVAAYVLAARVGGVALGAWTLLVWVAAPWLAMVLTLSSYDATLRDHVLPDVLGLTGEPGYVAGVALLSAAALLARPGLLEAVAAGVATAVAIVLVPEVLVFVVPAAVALLAAWRLPDLGAFLVAAAPALVVAAVWRQPAFGELSVTVLQGQSAGLREYFWSQRVLQWLPLAGAIAVARRAPAVALLLVGWLVAAIATAAARVGVGFAGGELFRVLLPALPVYVVLAAALPLLVPTLTQRLGPLARPISY